MNRREGADTTRPPIGFRALARRVRHAGAIATALAALAIAPAAAQAAPPTISATSFSAVTDTTAILEGTVNPNNRPIRDYHFQYVTAAACESDVAELGPEHCFDHAQATPAGELPSGTSPVEVSASLTGLDPTTLYHFRLVATNANGTATGAEVTFFTYSAPPGFGSCANDALRTGAGARLPDCRAYEQASPVDKNGFDLRGNEARTAVSLAGDAVSYDVKGGIPGADGLQDNPIFVAHRGAENWTSRGALPSPATIEKVRFQAFSRDLRYSFVAGTDYPAPYLSAGGYAHDTLTGADLNLYPQSLVAQGDDSERSLGASANGSVFALQDGFVAPAGFSNVGSKLTPDAAGPNLPNVYAYDRAAGALKLAGVVPPGSDSSCGPAGPACVTPGVGSSIEGGTDGGYPEDRNVLSSGGDQLLFNAADSGNPNLDGQLYARQDPTSPDASTLEVSASQRTDCADNGPCNGDPAPDPLGRRPATFQWATPTGSKVLFTSPEELTDDATTGPTGDLPAIGRADLADGANPDKAFASLSSANGSGNIATDADHLYWSDSTSNAIGRADINPADCSPNPVPCNVDQAFIAGLDSPQGIAVDSGHIYWTAAHDGSAGSGAIGRADLNGSGAATNVNQTCITGASDPRGIAVHAGFAYWLNNKTGGNNGTLARADVSGDCATANASANQTYVDIVGGGGISVTGVEEDLGSIAVNDESVYYSTHEATNTGLERGFVRRINLDGSGALSTVLALSPQLLKHTQAPALALDGSHLYYGDYAAGVIARQDIAGVDQPYADDVNSHGDLFVAGRYGPISIYGPDGSPIAHTFAPYRTPLGDVYEIAVDSQGYLYANIGAGASGFAGGEVLKFKPSNPGAAPTSATTYSLDTSIGESSPGANDGNGVIDPGATANAVAIDPANDDVYTSHFKQSEIQNVNFSGFASGDTFTLSGLPAPCGASTAAISYSTDGPTLRANADAALETACSSGANNDFSLSGSTSRMSVAFQGQFANKSIGLLGCAKGAGSGSCTVTPDTEGSSSYISQYHSNGALVTNTIGAGVSGANWVGLDVYGTNHNVYAADSANNKAYVLSAANLSGPPAVTIDGAGTPDHSLSFNTNITNNRGGHLDVDQSNGHLYLLDGAHNVLDQFDATGTYVSQRTSTPGAGVALDNSGGAANADIYVVNPATSAVNAFTSSYTPLPALSHSGYNPNPSFVADAPAAVGLALDSGHLYWTSGPPPPSRPGNDLYSWDRATRALTDLAPDPAETNGADVVGLVGVSDDGATAYFVANGVLASNPNSQGQTASAGDCVASRHGEYPFEYTGQCNLYRWHAGDPIAFIARLDATDGALGEKGDAANWVRTPWTGQNYVQSPRTGRVSADGSAVLFRSQAQQTAYDNQGTPELYRWTASGGLSCVSCNPTGAAPSSTPVVWDAPADLGEGFTPLISRNLSADGDKVFFETADKLVAADTNGDHGCPGNPQSEAESKVCQDVYEWEAPDSGSCTQDSSAYSAQDGGCLYLISTGAGSNPSYLIGASASGSDVFFFTRDALVPQDIDALTDVYDARTDGGLAAQHVVPPPGCDVNGGECERQGTSPSAAPGAASAAFQGPVNPPIVRCPVNKVKRHGRCVAKPHRKKRHHKRKHRRAAKHNRRARR